MPSYEKYVNPRIKAQEIYLQEVRRRMADAEKALADMESRGYQPEPAMILYKFAFTLKGNGQMVGLWDIADPASDIMVALLLLGKYETPWNSGISGFLRERLHEIGDQLNRLSPGQVKPAEENPSQPSTKKARPAPMEQTAPEPAESQPAKGELVLEPVSPAAPIESAADPEPDSASYQAPVVEEEPAKSAVEIPKPTEQPSNAPSTVSDAEPATAAAPSPQAEAPPAVTEEKPEPQVPVQPEPEPKPKPVEKKAAPAEPQSVKPVAPSEAADDSRERTILLIDDDPSLIPAVQEALRAQGCQLSVAKNFKEAEQRMSAQWPDLTILDILKKPEEAVKFSRAVRRIGSRKPIPLIFLSPQEAVQEKLSGYTTEADDYLARPFKTGELVSRIQVILNRSQRNPNLIMQDTLTKLHNYRYLLNQLNTELDYNRRAEGSFSLGLFNLDAFKRVNEMYGRLAGDETLICLIERVQANLRPTDLICRYGEDTFVVLMPNTTKYEGFCFMDRIREAVVREPFPLFQRWLNVHLTISAGISSYPIDDETAEGLIKAAASNLQQAKKDGRNRVNM